MNKFVVDTTFFMTINQNLLKISIYVHNLVSLTFIKCYLFSANELERQKNLFKTKKMFKFMIGLSINI